MKRIEDKDALGIIILYIAVIILFVIGYFMPAKNSIVPIEIKPTTPDTCNACAIHRIYGLKKATPHYK